MTGRKWCPSELLDETVPIAVADPSEALSRDEGGFYRIADEDGVLYLDPLAPGDVVDWSYSEPRGSFTVTKAEDGSFTVDREIVGEVTCWWVPGDGESVDDTLESLVANSLEPGESEVEAYYWSDSIPHRFEIEGGKGRFIRCDAEGTAS